ncbi:fatty acid metabolism transcriptional regulator FadR [Psychromonas sp. Urea-02u-13]|uniref:fatty acid metabolism transcriptional regulator FadR n=1 Tax=Psychromonas sp. Urea-02u-13 TaxID=2058326 RepID=UPI000C32727F|nr:fatty acid metabolism transcriptional regulator FadR [Psychromonas sp. Urea-02u-13]PKG39024.1 fatty acid metabolism transcriptional regulator FadR [Psychromonas sp. Urea-02u-13]
MIMKAKGPADVAEQYLIESIWNGSIAINSELPAERFLADKIGVTRTTLREVLQRLSKDGWITIRHGKSTKVNDFWETSGLNILSTLTRLDVNRRSDFIDQLMSVRTNISTIILRMAAKNNNESVLAFLENTPSIDASSEEFAEFDYRFYHQVAVSSNNMIYVLILNGLQDLYRKVGIFYFSNSEARSIALNFYADIKAVLEKGEIQQIMQIVRDSAFASGKIWLRLRHQLPADFLD